MEIYLDAPGFQVSGFFKAWHLHLRRNLGILAGVVLLSLSATADAKDGGAVYTGTLGAQSVVMEINTASDASIDGKYFYTNHHRDLQLSGTENGPCHLKLVEGPDDADSPRPQIDLTRQADGSLSGSWRSPKGKSLTLMLQPAKVAAPAASTDHYLQRLYSHDLYEYLRLSALTLRQGRQEKFMGYTIKWWVEPDSKITLFEILDGYSEGQRTQINQVLRDRLWTEVSAFHACMLQASRFGGDFEQTVTPRLLTQNAISISVQTSYDCGGAHPDLGDEPINLDAHNALALTLEDVLWVGNGQALHYVDNAGGEGVADSKEQAASVSFDTFSDYRDKYLAPWLVKQFTALYSSKIKDDDCDYTDSGVWNFPSWYLTSKGISLTPSFARVERVCEANDDWSVLPYALANKHPGRLHLVLP